MISAPKEFNDVCRNMGPSLEEFAQTPEDIMQAALSGVGPVQAKVISRFLDELLGQDLSPEQLKEFWWSTPATTVFLKGEEIATFLKRMREVLLQPPYT